MKRSRNQGFTSAVVVLLMFVVLVLVLGLAAYTSQTMLRSKHESDDMLAFQATQAVLEHQVSASYEYARGNGGFFQDDNQDYADFLTDFGTGATGFTQVATATDPSRAWVTATVTLNGRTKSIRSYINAKDVSIWNNAIFAGTGAVGQAINGNVDIRGSVHILGDGEPYSDLNGNGQRDPAEAFTDTNRNGVWDPGEPFVDTNGDNVWNSAEPFNDTNYNNLYDPPATTTDLSSDLSGTAHIGNNYTGMPTDLEALLPAPPVINGQESLSTEVRVKHGQIALSGTATIGSSSDADGGGSKGSVSGVYVNDGWGGNKGAANVNSDNGTSNAYDLEPLGIEFPIIDGIGAQIYTDAKGNSWSTHKQYFDGTSMVIPVNAITGSTAAFTYSDGNGNYVSYTPAVKSGKTIVSPPVLHIEGVVKINGNLAINGQSELRYTGKGTLYATQDVYIGNNLLPASGTTFPTTSVLGIVAGRNMGLATGAGDAQIKMAGAFYAQGTISSAKQNQIAGTFVANFFDMGKNVPNIYQVPKLRYNMPPGMPGDEPLISMKVKSWRERQLPAGSK